MNFQDYIPLAIRTESKSRNYLTGKMCTQAERLRHSAMGLITEAAELLDAYKKHIYYGKPLDRVNIEEEVGDLAWYYALMCDVAGYKPRDDSDFAPVTTIQAIGQLTARVSIDFLCYRSKDAYDCFIASPKDTCQWIFENILTFCENEKLSLTFVLEKNIAKLRARYPDKFDSDKAINRDLQKEREILEG